MAEALFSISATLPTRGPPRDGVPHPNAPPLFSGRRFLTSATCSLMSSTHWTMQRARPPLPCSCSHAAAPASAKTGKKRPPVKKPVFSEGRDDLESRSACPGCGVFMQDEDPNLPGYYQEKAVKAEELEDVLEENFGLLTDEEGGDLGDGLVSRSDFDEDMVMVDGDFDSEGFSDVETVDGKGEETEGEWESEWESDWDSELEDDEEKSRKELDGFGPAGVGFGNMTEEILNEKKREKISKAERKKRAREAQRWEQDTTTVCARCHSLRNYGQVKNEKAENLIPDFDFDRLITSSLMKPASNAPVVVMVVDCVDFDGSFPKRAAKSLFKVLDGSRNSKLTKQPKLVLVATKVDLLPSQISPTRLDRWVRNRARAGGAPKLSGVYLVSARKDVGVRNLLSFIKELCGPRGNVWVIGAQNAGKSTLINAIAKKEGVKITRLTEAAVPGTTLGIIRMGGILPAKAKMYDTPGLLHPYLMSMRLNREEQKMIEIRKELQPHTYRIKEGQTIHVGGLARLDLTQSSVDTIYITIWTSPSVSLHLGKTENADEIWNKHVGVRLQPPIEQDRPSEIGQWKPREFKLSGISWDVNNTDLAIAGLGWLSFGLKGEATVLLSTYNGIEITEREPLVLDRARFLERPGFLLPKFISDAVGNQSKLEAKAKKSEDTLLEVSI